MTQTTTAKRSQTHPPIRAGLYLRISSDRDNDELGVKRQENEGRALIARKPGWVLAEIYIDNDTSADVGVTRHAYQRMLADARAGKIDAIVGWSVDRLTRQPRECEDLIDLADHHGIQLATVGGEIDISTSMGQLCMRILVAYANSELKTRRARQLAERRQHAGDGKVHHGGKRPFGYLPDKIHIDETEATFIREAARRVLAGESLRGVCADFADRGVTGTSGRPFKLNTLRQILCSARISGRREHWQGAKGEARPRIAPITGIGTWQAIISIEDSDALRSLFALPSRRSSPTLARRHLLPGFLRCSVCERSMGSHHVNQRLVYACRNDDPQIHCRKSVDAKGIEDMIVRRVLATVETPGFLEMLHERQGVDRDLVKQLARDTAEREEIAREKARGDLTAGEWRVMRDELTARIVEAEAIIQKQMASEALAKLLHDDGTAIADRWEEMTLDQRRAILGMTIEQVIVKPGGAGQRFNTKRVEISWLM